MYVAERLNLKFHGNNSTVQEAVRIAQSVRSLCRRQTLRMAAGSGHTVRPEGVCGHTPYRMASCSAAEERSDRQCNEADVCRKEFLSVGQNLMHVSLNHRRSGLECEQPLAGIDKARESGFVSMNTLLGEMRKDEKIFV